MNHVELEPEQLRRVCDPTQLNFRTTSDLEDIEDVVAQPRAVEALAFGIGVEHQGYNIYALGPPGIGKRFAVERFLRARAESRDTPDDWCYVNNFQEPHKPRCIRLPGGRGVELERDMEQLSEDLSAALDAAFASDEYKTRRHVIDEEFGARPESKFAELREHAEKRGFVILRTPVGVVFAPRRDGEVLPPEEFEKIPEGQRQEIERDMKELQAEFQEFVGQLPDWERERQRRLRQLNREVTHNAVTRLISELRAKYESFSDVLAYLDQVERDVVDNARAFLAAQGQAQAHATSDNEITEVPVPESLKGAPALRRYQVNVVVANRDGKGAPVIFEDHPTYGNLVGRIEHLSQLGTLTTDFRLIRPGALHRANGGYLVIEARQLLMQPFAYEGLKRALQSREIRIESLGQALSLVATISLEPETIPLDVKVVLLGDRMLYYRLAALDPEFSELFKVAVDFDDEAEWSGPMVTTYCRTIATMVRREDLRPFGRDAVARIVEECARMAGDQRKLSTSMSRMIDLLREADYFAGSAGRDVASKDDVQRAIEAREYRSNRVKERLQEQTLREVLMIDCAGTRVGQINGLSVMQLADYRFARPTRITARVHMGKGNVVDIERETELGGPIHSKGVLILTGFLSARYGGAKPFALSASLVFEQSYGGVDGDSASSAELYALLSAIGDVPLRQSLAVTGSINQHGDVQAIGGVNEKIEGFFDLCMARGLTGTQGVLIPKANADHLMLRHDVIKAVDEDSFHIYPIEHVDQGIELLTGMEAGKSDALGNFPDGSVNAIVDARIAAMAENMAKIGRDRPKADDE
ncbi:MAG: AAA family ATPase [Proteobacteria bacterium]|nr:AAA family ATPase [Pseudomonadota bacterium]